MERCAAKGATAFAFSENPAPLGLPTIHDQDHYWDPVMAAANDLELVVSMHVGSSSQVPQIAPHGRLAMNGASGAICGTCDDEPTCMRHDHARARWPQP